MRISNCCEAPPLGELYYEPEFIKQAIGMCSSCKEHAEFKEEKKENENVNTHKNGGRL